MVYEAHDDGDVDDGDGVGCGDGHEDYYEEGDADNDHNYDAYYGGDQY